MKITAGIVGAHFRPPAKAILKCLHNGAPLLLEHEPNNPYDENAIKVLVASATIKPEIHQELELHSMGQGYSLEDILGQETWQLGYIPRTENTGDIRSARVGTFVPGADDKTHKILIDFDAQPKPSVDESLEQILPDDEIPDAGLD